MWFDVYIYIYVYIYKIYIWKYKNYAEIGRFHGTSGCNYAPAKASGWEVKNCHHRCTWGCMLRAPARSCTTMVQRCNKSWVLQEINIQKNGYQNFPTAMWLKHCHKPSASHHHFYTWGPFPVMGSFNPQFSWRPRFSAGIIMGKHHLPSGND